MESKQIFAESIHMIDHAYHTFSRSHSVTEIERSNSELCFDEQTERVESASAVEEFASDEERVMEEADWNEGGEMCHDQDWDEWDNGLVTDSCPPHDGVWVDDGDSSGGEWSVHVLKRNGEWSDTESVESKKSVHTVGNGNTDIAQDDWNVEVLDPEPDWNDDAVDGDDLNNWHEDLKAELQPADDWNVEILDPTENNWSTQWDEEEDLKTFHCDQCEKQYLHKSSLAKHKLLIHRKRLSRWSQSSDEDA